MNKKSVLSLMLCLCLVWTMVPAAGFAQEVGEQENTYLALGDSISTGYGLLVPDTEGFVNLLAYKLGYNQVQNAAINGNTAEGILEQLKSGELDDAVKSADLITITVGGNDLMHPLYEKIAAAYNATYKLSTEPALEGSQLTEFVKSAPSMVTILNLMNSTKFVLQGPEADGFADLSAETVENVFGDDVHGYIDSAYFEEHLKQFGENLNSVLKDLRKKNTKAVIVVSSQYNPYVFFTEENAAPADAVIMNQSIGEGALILNKTIKSVIREINSSKIYMAEEIHTAFDTSEINLCNAAVAGSRVELDFHPNAEGHAVIADIMAELITEGTPVIKDPEYRDELKKELKEVTPELKSSLKKSNGKYSVQLSWSVPDGVKLDGYEVFRSTKKSSGYGTKPYYETKKMSYKNSSVKKGKTYYYKVRGYIKFGDKRLYTDWSNRASRKIK